MRGQPERLPRDGLSCRMSEALDPLALLPNVLSLQWLAESSLPCTFTTFKANAVPQFFDDTPKGVTFSLVWKGAEGRDPK